MSLPDRVDPGSDVLAELPLALGLVGLLVAAFFIGSIVGAEAMAAGEPVFPPRFLPGLVGHGQATDMYVRVYETTKMALWGCSVGVLGAVVLSALVHRD
jgi:ABC-type phosphate/phosphonate transport system permease subunit